MKKKERFLKNIVKAIYLVLVLCYLQGCIEPYKFEIPETRKSLVVEGFISTESKSHEVLLNYSNEYYDDKNVNSFSGATVKIISDKGDVYDLYEVEIGRYLTEPLAGEVNKSYKLSIESADGSLYESGFEPIIVVNPFDSLYYEYVKDEFTGSGISIFASGSELSEVPPYILWDYTGHQEVYYLYSDPNDYEAGEAIYSCISNEKNINYLNISSDKIKKGSIYNQFIAKIPYNTLRKYVLKVEKKSISPTAYQFFNQINRLSNISGSVFDSPPTLIKGNIVNVHNSDEIVHGYFYASDVYQEIFTVERNSFPFPPDEKSILVPRQCTKSPRACMLEPLNLPVPLPCPDPPDYWY